MFFFMAKDFGVALASEGHCEVCSTLACRKVILGFEYWSGIAGPFTG
jgi:hypothetical protein